MSPVAIEAQDSRFEPYRPVIVECIRANGGEVEEGAGREQVILAANAVQEEGVDCLAQSGFQPVTARAPRVEVAHVSRGAVVAGSAVGLVLFAGAMVGASLAVDDGTASPMSSDVQV